MKVQAAKAGLLRSMNRSAVVDFIRREQTSSASQIASNLGISLPTVIRVLETLRAEGLVDNDGYEDSSGGRPATRVRFCGEAHAVIVVHTALDAFSGAVCDLSGKIIHERTFVPGPDGDENVASLIRMITELKSLPRPGVKSLRGIGVGVPGMIRKPEGRVVLTLGLGWRDLPLLALLSAAFEEPVFLESNNNLAVVGEWAFGAGQHVDHLVNLYIGPGASAGIMIAGKIYRGGGGAAGELKWYLDDPRLGGHAWPLLGDRESLRFGKGIPVSALSLLERAGKDYQDGKLSLADCITDRPAEGLEIVHELFEYATMAVTSIAAILNPKRIVLSGGLARGGALVIDVVRSKMEGDVYEIPDIVLTELGSRAVLLGGVMTVLEATTLRPEALAQSALTA